MTRVWVVLACMTLGCGGPYAMEYQFRSRIERGDQPYEVMKEHAHGVGPLIVGGGGLFLFFQAMSPALIDYTGEVDLRKICPAGQQEIAEVRHSHTVRDNLIAAFISWFTIGNWYHLSEVEYDCVAPAAPVAPAPG